MKYALYLISIVIVGSILLGFTFKKNKADKIIAKAFVRHGGKLIPNAKISFDFRNRHYVANRQGGAYSYERIFTDKENQKIHDTLTNDSFQRTTNGEKTAVPKEKAMAYSSSINSVIYFALLPFNLKDPAVVKEYLGEEIIDNRPYYKVKVTFHQEGGGEDYDDEYVYWIHKANYTMDYLAYNYHVDGGGARFRSAYNIRNSRGIRFADYVNYKPMEKDNRAVESFGKLFQDGQLKELSRIETENINVEILK